MRASVDAEATARNVAAGSRDRISISNDLPFSSYVDENTRRLILEVLLDIRQLLISIDQKLAK